MSRHYFTGIMSGWKFGHGCEAFIFYLNDRVVAADAQDVQQTNESDPDFDQTLKSGSILYNAMLRKLRNHAISNY